MIFRSSNEYEADSCRARVEYLISKKADIEVNDKRPRSLNQGNYLHMIVGIVAMDVGLTLEEAKRIIFKDMINPDIYVVEKNVPHVGVKKTYKSTKEVGMENTSKAIDRFKVWARSEGYIIPEPGDKERLHDIEMEMRKCRWL